VLLWLRVRTRKVIAIKVITESMISVITSATPLDEEEAGDRRLETGLRLGPLSLTPRFSAWASG